jgi:hypothetical protein
VRTAYLGYPSTRFMVSIVRSRPWEPYLRDPAPCRKTASLPTAAWGELLAQALGCRRPLHHPARGGLGFAL